jgi:hypothetical protein
LPYKQPGIDAKGAEMSQESIEGSFARPQPGAAFGAAGSGVLAGAGGLKLVAWFLLVFLLLRAMIFGIAAGLLDPDYFWHLRTGQWIVENGALPTVDIFSYTAAGEPWVLHEWLFQVLLYLVYEAGGESLVMFMTALIGGSALFLFLLAADRWIRSPVASLVLTIAFASTFVTYVIPRPHIFSFLFFGVLLHVLWAARYDGKLRSLFILPPLMVLWVNLHGGYFIALAFLFGFMGLEWLRCLLAEGKPPLGYLKALTLCCVATLLAACLNQDGPQHLLYPLYVMGQSANSFINEWKSPNFQKPMAQWFLAAVMAFFFLLINRRERPDLTELMIPLITIAAGFISLRHTPFAVMIMIAYAGQAIGKGALEPLARLAKPRRDAGGAAQRQISPRAEKLMAGGIVLFLVAGIAISVFDQGYAERRQAFLTDVTDFVVENDLQGPMLNQYGLGGLLIQRLYPERKVYIDGRADLYGDERVEAYSDMVALRPGWRETFEAGAFSYVVMSEKAALTSYLKTDPRYGLAFRDEGGKLIFLRRNPKHEALIEAYANREKKSRSDEP